MLSKSVYLLLSLNYLRLVFIYLSCLVYNFSVCFDYTSHFCGDSLNTFYVSCTFKNLKSCLKFI